MIKIAMVKSKFYVTTPIYYPNDVPHLGHAYTTIAADVLARWHSLLGEDVFFLTGTDEHGKKLQLAAERAGKSPKEFVDSMIPEFKKAWEKLNIKYSRFIRTTDKDHESIVQKIVKKSFEFGDIYKGNYEGLYCTSCEAYYTEKDAPKNLCPIHNKPLDLLKEESYFFRLSKYQKALLNHYKKHPEFISPESKRMEVINRVKEGLQDLSVSRSSFSWGIPLPFDKKHVLYVWQDALFNYYTATREKGREKFWPADVHIIGKDILWFHTVYWPAFLLSAGIELPKKVFAHGWWTVLSQKMGKSAGNAIKIDQLISKGVDTARYFLLREAPFGQDGDFSEQSLAERHNNELANKLGNLVSRVSVLAETYGLKKSTIKFLKSEKTKRAVHEYLENLEFDKALNKIFSFIDECNTFIQDKKPWEKETKDREKILYELASAIKDFTILLSPFIPETCEKIANIFNFDISIKSLNAPLKISKIKKSSILFAKIDVKDNNSPVNKKKEQNKLSNINNKANLIDSKPSKTIDNNKEKVNKSQKIEGIMSTIEFKDWEKLDLRVGKIEKVENIEGADKLYKLTVNLGNEKRTLVAGIKQHYLEKELKEKKVIVFTNLAPRMMKGIESQGMLLAAVSDDESKVILISPEKDIKEGSKVR